MANGHWAILMPIKSETESPKPNYTCSKTRLTENVYPLTPTLTLTLTRKHNVFGLTKWHFSSKCAAHCTDTSVANSLRSM